jgi:NTE family protein
MRWPWWLVKPRLAVVLGGGATLGAFEVGMIDVLAKRGIVPDLLVGTSVGAINAAMWALDPKPDIGERLLHFWLESDHSTMFPDGPFPMVGRLVQRSGHLTTQDGLARALKRALPEHATLDDTVVPLAIIATQAEHGQRVVLRRGPLRTALLASSAIPGLWPAVNIDGQRLFDGGLVANCDLQTAVEAGMTDVILVDVMGDGLDRGSMDLGKVIEGALRILLRHQTELALRAFGTSTRVAVLRPNLVAVPRFADFSQTPRLFVEGQVAGEAFIARHMGPRRSVRPGIFVAPASSAPPDITPFPRSVGRSAPRLRSDTGCE